jgi:hypothetical protein
MGAHRVGGESMSRTPVLYAGRGRRALGAAVALALLVSLVPVASTMARSATHFLVASAMPTGGWVAGESQGVSVFARDPYEFTYETYTGTVHVTSTDPQAILPPDYTYTVGDGGFHVFSVTLRTAGTQWISVTEVSNPLVTGTSTPITVVAGAAAALGFAQQPGDGTAGVPLARQPIIHIRDAYGNLVSGASPTTVALALLPVGSGTLTCTDGTSKVTSSGVAAFAGCAVDRVGTGFWLQATATGLGLGGSASFTVSAAVVTADHYSIGSEAHPDGWIVGTSNWISVSARSGSALVSSYRGRVHFSSSDPAATLPADYTFTAADAGIHEFHVTFATAGTQWLAVTDVTAPSIMGSLSGLNVVGTGPPPPPPGAATLELAAYPATITIHGFSLFKLGFSSGGAGATIGLFWANVGSDSWNRVTTLTASAAGDASYSDNPGVTIDYRAVCEAGCPGGAASIASNRVRVVVRHVIALTPVGPTVRVVTSRTRLTYTARVEPTASYDRPRVTFSVYQKVRGAWVLRSQTTVRANSAGVARFARTWSTRGEWYVRARVLADRYNAVNNSPIRRIRVV